MIPVYTNLYMHKLRELADDEDFDFIMRVGRKRVFKQGRLEQHLMMSKYELSLRQEVLMEVGASILGDLFRYSEKNKIEDDDDPVSILYNLIRSAKQDVILSQTEAELEQIEGKFCLARDFLSGLEMAHAKGKELFAN